MSELPLAGEAPSSPRTANRLTLAQTFALGAWIKEHEQQAKDDPDTQGAAHAALDLGFTVTAANFTAARQALGIEKPKPTAPPSLEERMNKAEAAITDIRDQTLGDWNRVSGIRSAIDAKLAMIDQTLTNHRAGYEDLLKRLTTLEQRFQPKSDSTPLPPPGRMETECPTPTGN